MAIASIRCPVAQATVTMLTDLEGSTTRIICPKYEADGTCRLKRDARQGGPLSQLLERISEETLSDRTVACAFR